jgi:hypothetical protein
VPTDGSKTKDGTGAGIIAYHKGRPIRKESLGMGNQAEAFDAEKWALTKCLAWAISHTTDNPRSHIKTLNIYIDNAAVVKTVYDIAPPSGQWMGKVIRKSIDNGSEKKKDEKSE